MNIISLDLELTQPTNKIIEVGYCIGNFESGEIIDKGYYFCNPQEQISQYITDLTSIKQEDVDSAGSVLDAYNNFNDHLEKFQIQRGLFTWGCGDHEAFREQAGLENKTWRFGKRYTDVKTVWCAYAMANSMKMKGGLKASMEKLGLSFEGRQHRAVDDSINTFRIYHELLKRMKQK